MPSNLTAAQLLKQIKKTESKRIPTGAELLKQIESKEKGSKDTPKGKGKQKKKNKTKAKKNNVSGGGFSKPSDDRLQREMDESVARSVRLATQSKASAKIADEKKKPDLPLLAVRTVKEENPKELEKTKCYPVVPLDQLRELLQKIKSSADANAPEKESADSARIRETLKTIADLLSRLEYAMWVKCEEDDEASGLRAGQYYLTISERGLVMLKMCAFFLGLNPEITPVPRMNSIGKLMCESKETNGFLQFKKARS